MPPQQGKPFNLKAAFAAAKDNPVEVPRDFTDLPGGVTGTAKLVDLRFGVYKSGPNQGKRYFYGAGIVLTPRTALRIMKVWKADPKAPKGGRVEMVGPPVEEVVAGGRTSIGPIPLCDTTKNEYKDGQPTGKKITIPGQVGVDEVVNHLKLLGGEEVFGDDCDGSDDAINGIFQSLVEADPPIVFRFSTQWREPDKRNPEIGVWPHKWLGTNGVAEPAPVDPAAAVEDETGDAGSDDENETEDDAPADEEGGDEPEETGELPEDLDELATIADDPDSDNAAGDKLVELAVEAGVAGGSEKKIRAIETWAEVAQAIKDATDAPDEPEEAEDEAEEWTPAKDDVCYAKLPSSKDPKKLMPKASEVVVLSVNAKAGTVTLKNNVTGKTVLGADKKPRVYKFSELSQEE